MNSVGCEDKKWLFEILRGIIDGEQLSRFHSGFDANPLESVSCRGMNPKQYFGLFVVSYG